MIVASRLSPLSPGLNRQPKKIRRDARKRLLLIYTWKKAATRGNASALAAAGVAAGECIHSSSGSPGSKLSTSTWEEDGGSRALSRNSAALADIYPRPRGAP
jgi:hypothetical protein